MASTITTTRTIRIKNETAEYFKDKPLNKAVESLYEHLKSGNISFDGDEIKIIENFENTKECTHLNSDYEAVEEMARLMRVPTERLLADFRDLLESGDLYYTGNRLINPRYDEFEQICLQKKIDIDMTIGNIIENL